jgi:hypothetical protein
MHAESEETSLGSSRAWADGLAELSLQKGGEANKISVLQCTVLQKKLHNIKRTLTSILQAEGRPAVTSFQDSEYCFSMCEGAFYTHE